MTPSTAFNPGFNPAFNPLSGSGSGAPAGAGSAGQAPAGDFAQELAQRRVSQGTPPPAKSASAKPGSAQHGKAQQADQSSSAHAARADHAPAPKDAEASAADKAEQADQSESDPLDEPERQAAVDALLARLAAAQPAADEGQAGLAGWAPATGTAIEAAAGQALTSDALLNGQAVAADTLAGAAATAPGSTQSLQLSHHPDTPATLTSASEAAGLDSSAGAAAGPGASRPAGDHPAAVITADTGALQAAQAEAATTGADSDSGSGTGPGAGTSQSPSGSPGTPGFVPGMLGTPTATAAAGSAAAPLPEARLPAPPGHADFAPQLGAQISLFIREGVQQARLQLNPADMGPITVQIRLEAGAAQVHLAADNLLTRQALEQAMPTLAGSLREAGLTLTGGGVFEHAGQTGQGGQGSQEAQGQAGSPGEAARARRAGTADDTGPALGPLGQPLAAGLRSRSLVDLVA